ncbi:MAG: histidine phosphatase family protein [Acholeplasmataceae bacterium]
MILTLIRHGETDYNKNSLIQGHIDNPLNDTGISQAHKLGTKLKTLNRSFDFLGSSPLVRAAKTADIISKYTNMEVSFYDKHFMERDFGEFDGKYYFDVLDNMHDPNYKKTHYENDEMIIKRVKKGIMNLYQNYKGNRVAVVCHSHVIKSLLIISNPDHYDFNNYFIGNLSALTFKVNNDKIELIEHLNI